MQKTSLRIALAALLATLSTSALAAEPARDCTVCRDPMWPTLTDPMPGIPLDQVAQSAGPSAIATNATRETVAVRSNGVGVSATAAATTETYSDPLWPQVKTVPAGMAATVPVKAAPAAPKARVAPPATGPVASR